MAQSEQLAIHGGTPAITNAISSWPIASEAVKCSLHDAIEAHQWGCYEGPLTDRLKESLQQAFDCNHSELTCSGTMAVELALRGAGVRAGSEVVLAAYDFPGNFRAIEAIGAKPVLVDVLANSWVIDPDEIEKAISEQTSAVIVSHLHGQLAALEQIRQRVPSSVAIVEDCCQVPGATAGDQRRVCGSLGDVSVLSFGGSKLLSAGRGGAILSNEEAIIERARLFGARGNDAFPLSQLQAAVLVPQLQDLSRLNRRRQSAVMEMIDSVSLRCSQWLSRPETQQDSAWYKLPWLLSEKVDREVFLAQLNAEGVPIDIGFRGFAKRTSRRCRKVGDLPHARRAASQTVLLHHPVLLEPKETRDQVVHGFEKVVRSLDG